MSKRRNLMTPKTCDDSCEHFCYIGEGDSICSKTMPPKLVLDDWIPTDNFLWCGGNGK